MKAMCILWKSHANGENNLYAEVRRANQWLNEEALRIFDVQPLDEKSETTSSAAAEQRADCAEDTEFQTTPTVRRRSKRGRDNDEKSIEIIASSRFDPNKDYTECTINIGPFGFHGVAQETKYNDYYNYYFHWGQDVDEQSISEMSQSWGISNFKSQSTEDWSELGGPCCLAHSEFLVFENYVGGYYKNSEHEYMGADLVTYLEGGPRIPGKVIGERGEQWFLIRQIDGDLEEIDASMVREGMEAFITYVSPYETIISPLGRCPTHNDEFDFEKYWYETHGQGVDDYTNMGINSIFCGGTGLMQNGLFSLPTCSADARGNPSITCLASFFSSNAKSGFGDHSHLYMFISVTTRMDSWVYHMFTERYDRCYQVVVKRDGSKVFRNRYTQSRHQTTGANDDHVDGDQRKDRENPVILSDLSWVAYEPGKSVYLKGHNPHLYESLFDSYENSINKPVRSVKVGAVLAALKWLIVDGVKQSVVAAMPQSTFEPMVSIPLENLDMRDKIMSPLVRGRGKKS